MGSLLVVGCVSFDILHLESSAGDRVVSTIGGAGLYTALAAANQGADVTLLAPRPEPMPKELEVVDRHLAWLGPHCGREEIPALEIVHHGGGRATLLKANWGAEELLTQDCLKELLEFDFDLVHIAALSSAKKQNRFAQTFRSAGGAALLSGGTYARAIQDDREGVRSFLDSCDYFFMNTNEARLLFGDSAIPDRNLFVTGGADGATIYCKDGPIHVSAFKTEEVDPTGAGDTFCGATLAQISFGLLPQGAATEGARLAAKAIAQPGPSYFIDCG